MSISTHVLDATTGRPAAGLELALSRQDGGEWHELTRRRTDADGRVSDLATGAGLTDADPDAGPGIYRIVFLTEAYLKAQSPAAETFYPGGRGDLPDHRPGRAPSRAPAAQPVRLLDLPWLLTAADTDTGRYRLEIAGTLAP